MDRISTLILILIVSLSSISCTSDDEIYADQFWVIASSINAYVRPNVLSRIIQTYNFGDIVRGRDLKPRPNTPNDWLEIKIAPKAYGYVERGRIGDKAVMEEINALRTSIEGQQVQATGTIGKKSRFRLGPSRESRVTEFLREPQNASIYERIVKTATDKGKAKSEVWYKVRLEDGRVGYVYTGNLTFTPPYELNAYTQSRKAVSWQVLRVKEDKESGFSGKDYITAYTSAGIDIGADYNRVELYSYDTKSGKYSTSFAKSGLKGILPLNVIDVEGDKKIFQIRQLKKNKDNVLLVQEYSFPSPIKVIKEYEEELGPKTEQPDKGPGAQ